MALYSSVSCTMLTLIVMFSQITGKLHVGMIYDTRYTSLDWIDFGLETPTFSALWLLVIIMILNNIAVLILSL